MSEAKKLSPSDPVDKVTRDKLDDLGGARLDIAEQLLDMDMKRVQLLVSVQRLDEERNKLFERVLMERGLPPNTAVQIDVQTGIIKVLRPVKPEPEPKADPTPAS